MNRLIAMTLCVLLLGACASRQMYQSQLDFVRAQQADRAAALDAKSERLAQRQEACAALAEAGAISACMLGVTATTLALQGGGGAEQPIIAPPTPPPSGLQVFGDFLLGFSKVAAPVVLGIRQSDNSTRLGIAQGEQLYGFLGRTAEAQAAFGTAALGSMERSSVAAVGTVGDVALGAVDAAADTSTAWAQTAPLLAPDIHITGDGNVLGDGNTLDQSSQGRDRIGEGAGNALTLDQSNVAGNRQDGENNRQSSPGPYNTEFECQLVANGAAGGAGAPGTGTGATGGAGAAGGTGTGILTCTPGSGG